MSNFKTTQEARDYICDIEWNTVAKIKQALNLLYSSKLDKATAKGNKQVCLDSYRHELMNLCDSVTTNSTSEMANLIKKVKIEVLANILREKI